MLYNAEMLESLLATNAQTPKDARRTTATMAKPAKEDEGKKKRDCATKKRERRTGCGGGDGNALAAPSTARALSLRVSQQSSAAWFHVCVFLSPVAFSGVAGRARLVFVLSAQQKAPAKERAAEERPSCAARHSWRRQSVPLLFYVECN